MTTMNSLSERLAAVKVSDTHFKSKYLPVKAGDLARIAFGGWTIGFAVNAGALTASSDRQLYSILGQFHGPVSAESTVTAEVINLRETRTFSSRQVKIFQEQPNGTTRLCLLLLLDFKTSDQPLLMYSVRPARDHPDIKDCPSVEATHKQMIKAGDIEEDDLDTYEMCFGILQSFFETVPCPDSVSAQNLSGIAKKRQTTQDQLAFTDKVSAEWIRCHEETTPDDKRYGDIAFVLDAGLAFLPLIHSHRFYDDAGDCSTLEFAIRIWSSKPDLREWHLRERTTTVGSGGLTYCEGRLFSKDRKMIASMTQQCILRCRPDMTERAQL